MPLTGAIGAAISGGTGLLSSLLGLGSQKSANKTNLKIAQMNNEWSERMMEKQHAYDLEMWNKNNEYNSFANQVKRIKEGGGNPALMLGNMSAGIASGGNSVGLPSPSRAEVKPLSYEGFANSINNSLQMLMSMDRNNAEVNAIIENQDFKRQELRAKLALMAEQTHSQMIKNEIDEITKDIEIGHRKDRWLETIQNRVTGESVEQLNKQLIIAHNLVNQNLPDKLAMEVAVMASQVDLNKFNSQHEVGKLVESLKKRGYKLTKSQENAIFEALISKVENEANIIGSPWQLIGNTISGIKRIKTKNSDY